jgi:hypothetical protein
MTEDPLESNTAGRRPSLTRRTLRAYGRFVRMLSTLVVGALVLVLAVFFVNYVVLSTAKGRAYRNLDPASDICREGLDHGWSILADMGRASLRSAPKIANDGGWIDVSDDEDAAIAKDGRWEKRLRCALQRHIIPATKPGHAPLEYTLGFLEFQENGEPYALVADDTGARDKPIDSAMLQHAMEGEMHAHHMAAADVTAKITQLDVLTRYLSTGSHYVIVFIHGWRNDARIGNANVADLRLYAGHAARFIAERCAVDKSFCGMKVDAIYVGWRGARVDEKGLRADFGDTIGGGLGSLSAAATLFDRKPVSETIAPAAVSALRTIENVLSKPPAPGQPTIRNKMIVFGHSLGGNMLATGLKDDLVKSVRRHKYGETLPPVLGDLVVLINPASEATKWTTIQREVWDRTAFFTDMNTSAADVIRDNDMFPVTQRPVIVSVTAALAFPAGGLRSGDCAWIGLDFDDRFKTSRQKIRQRLAATDSMFDTGVDYDWATHDLFPTFKFDFRPAAAYLDRVAARIEGGQPQGESCEKPRPIGLLTWFKTAPLHALSLLAATFPFQNSNMEESHTIGNLDPPRPAAGVLADALPSAAPFGTTHELLGLHAEGLEQHNPYATLADADISCPLTNQWLMRARDKKRAQYGLFWDSEDLAPEVPNIVGQGRPAAQFLHGLNLTGIAPITRANDPFWNIRAFDNALSRHDGYRLTSFICAMNQLALDDITGSASHMATRMADPDNPMVNPAR